MLKCFIKIVTDVTHAQLDSINGLTALIRNGFVMFVTSVPRYRLESSNDGVALLGCRSLIKFPAGTRMGNFDAPLPAGPGDAA